MDIKVYKKEEVRQPSGTEYVYVPDVIDFIPEIVETTRDTSFDIKGGVWSLKNLQRVADVKIENNRLIINSNNVRYEDGILYVTVKDDSILGVEELEDDSKDLLEQQCALATIFQKGLDPLDLDEGISWSQAILEEISVYQIMEELKTAVANVTSLVQVSFDTVTDTNGVSYLKYKLEGVA